MANGQGVDAPKLRQNRKLTRVGRLRFEAKIEIREAVARPEQGAECEGIVAIRSPKRKIETKNVGFPFDGIETRNILVFR
jgi:hypothetical protein